MASESITGEWLVIGFSIQRSRVQILRHLVQLETTGGAAEASEAAAAAGVRPPRPSNWEAMTRDQRKNWKKRGGKRC